MAGAEGGKRRDDHTKALAIAAATLGRSRTLSSA